MPASRIKAIGRRKFATKYAAARPPETNHLIRRGELRLFGTLPRLHRKRSRLRVYRFPGTSNGPCSALPERDLNSLSHRLIDAAVLEIRLTEIFPPAGAMHRAIPVSADRAAPVGPAHRREKPASRHERAKSRETWTLRWRGLDSKFQSRGK